MRKKINQIIKHPLISGSIIMFIGSSMISFLNFIFNLFMSRNLSVSDYGILASLISLITLSTLPAGSFIPLVVNFAASYFAKNDLAMVRGLFLKIMKPLFFLGILVFVVFLFFAQKIGQFFNIHNDSLIIMAGLIAFLSFISVVNMPLLQAKLAFAFIVLLNFVSSFSKLFLGIAAVFFGFSIGGVMWALFLSSLIPYLLSFFPLKFLFQKRTVTPQVSNREIISFGLPAAVIMLGLTSFITTDIILVKHFFNPVNAGIYAGLSLIGRVIFFFSAPIGTVMFPLITQRHTRKENYHNLFKLSLLLVFLASVCLTVFYFFCPEFIIGFFLKKQEYLSAANLLGFFGIFISLYSVTTIVVNFYLSIRETKIVIPIIIFAVLQGFLIWLYHNTFLQIIMISLGTISLLLIALLLYYWRLYEKRTTE